MRAWSLVITCVYPRASLRSEQCHSHPQGNRPSVCLGIRGQECLLLIGSESALMSSFHVDHSASQPASQGVSMLPAWKEAARGPLLIEHLHSQPGKLA